MVSLRAWLVSGTFAAGIGAGILCGAGVAAADSGGNSETVKSQAETAKESPRAERNARRAPGSGARPAPAAVTRARDGLADLAAALPASVKSPSAVDRGPRARVARAAAVVSNVPAAKDSPATAPVAAAVTKAATPVPAAPSSVPVDPAKFAGTYYEQGSVKQFFSIGLVNTKATYTLNPDGTIKVQNSGNYFFNRGPRSSIVGSAVSVNADNTALNVGFSPFSPPSANPPGNYTILYHAPDYSYVIVSDPSGRSGYILTRSKTISPAEYAVLLDQARSLGVKGRITPTKQYA